VRRSPVALATLFAALLLALAIPVAAISGPQREAGRLHADLVRIGKLAGRAVKPPTAQLARDLPAATKRVERLREPASTAQAQIGIALDELRQMKSLVVDPHYLPALTAAGRAYLAISGNDPLTRTTVNPDYRGLEPELAAEAASLGGSAAAAKKASDRVERLTRLLVRAKRRARRLERRVGRLRRAGAGAARR
jgi:hypothetical protein